MNLRLHAPGAGRRCRTHRERKAAALLAGCRGHGRRTLHCAEMLDLEVSRRLERAFEPRDLDGKWLVVTATGDRDVDAAVFEAAERRRVWCNAADDPGNCSATLPARVELGDVTVSVSSGARSPAASSWLRRRIEAILDDDTLAVFEIAARVRQRMRSAGLPTEVEGWSEVLDSEALEMVAAGREAELERLLSERVGAPAP
ncbi:MAG: bifunctional precorrin-2 dehydrogenase/sirohydrochlorin ferrochelatase [Microthrixaceae bacterium]